MYATANKKMLNMLILDILKEYSDGEHRLSQQEIIRILNREYGMACDRRSVKNNVEYLKELGYDISMEKGYYLAEREFEDSELRLLIDAVLFSIFFQQILFDSGVVLVDLTQYSTASPDVVIFSLLLSISSASTFALISSPTLT